LSAQPQLPATAEKKIVVEPPPDAGSDLAAQKEASGFASRDLRRYDRMQDHIHIAMVWALYAVAAAVFLMSLVWLYHLLVPLSWQFLTDAQQNKLDNALVTILGSSFVVDRARRTRKP
jgi:hypothetical protein